MTQATLPAFVGSAKEQALAGRIWTIMTRWSMTYARGVLIRQTVANVSAALGENGQAVTVQQVDAVVRQNPAVFEREERNGELLIATTRDGISSARPVDRIHTFAQRLYEPQFPLDPDDLNNVVTLIKPIVPIIEPVHISSYWRGQRAPVADSEAPAGDALVLPSAPTFVAPTIPAVPAPAMITLSDGSMLDLRLPIATLMEQSGLLQDEVRTAFDNDATKRIVGFADYYYTGNVEPNFGKNDLRRIREYIVEQGEPLTDGTIMQDIYREQPGSSRFDLACFGLDYRLAREKDFEFVGVPGVYLWSAKGLAALGTKRLKASDIGQLYSFLPEGYDDEHEAIEGLVQHTLTSFEWEYGILPLNSALSNLLPLPVLPDQRTAVIRIEFPQQSTTALCEVRFPTGTRGGWVWGLEQAFHDFLVPGTIISLNVNDDPTLFTLQYTAITPTDAKVLTLDEKRNRFAFTPTPVAVETNPALLPTQAAFNKLRNLKPLTLVERKKPEVVLTHVFETIGEQLGSKEEPLYWIQFNELWMALNVLRPMSHAYLQHLLQANAIFYADETTVGAYYYKPLPADPAAVEAPVEDETPDDEG